MKTDSKKEDILSKDLRLGKIEVVARVVGQHEAISVDSECESCIGY